MTTCFSQHSPCSPGTRAPGMEAFIHAWQSLWNGGVRSLLLPQGPLSVPAALVCLGCLPAHPSASSQAWNDRNLMESKREGGVGPSQCHLQAHLPWGWCNRETQSKKLAAGRHVAGTKKRFVQKAKKLKKMEVPPDTTTVPGLQARTDRGPCGQIDWGWGCAFSQAALICKLLGTLGSAGLKKSY